MNRTLKIGLIGSSFTIVKTATIAILLFIFHPCSSQVAGIDVATQIDTVIHGRRNCMDCPVKNDTVIYKLLKCGLFHASNGDLAYKTIMWTNDSGGRAETYLERTCGGFEELKNVIDTTTFKFLSAFYWKDKKHIYYVFYTSDGAKMCIGEKINHGTFEPFGESCYGSDKKHIYFRDQVITEADRQTFKVSADSECIARDKNNWYFYGKKMTDEEIKSFGLSKN